MENAERMAFSIGIHTDEFEQMQPYEFYVCLEGYREAQKQKDIRTAYWMTWLLSPYSKKPLSVKRMIEPLWHTQENQVQKAREDREYLIKEFGLENGKGK